MKEKIFKFPTPSEPFNPKPGGPCKYIPGFYPDVEDGFIRPK